MRPNYCAECQSYYDANLRSKYGIPTGAEESEIRRMEKKLGHSFPPAYRQFLRWMGNDYEGVLRGSEWFLSDIPNNNKLLPELLADNGVNSTLNSPYLCFFSHQGYMAAWFFLSEGGSDPICYFYSEADSIDNEISVGSFSSFLLTELKGVEPKAP